MNTTNDRDTFRSPPVYTALNSPGFRNRADRGQNDRGESGSVVLNGEPLAPFGAAPLDNRLAGLRLHAVPKPVLFRALPVVRLKGTLRHLLLFRVVLWKTLNLPPTSGPVKIWP